MTTQNDVPTFDDLTRLIAEEMIVATDALVARYGFGPVDMEAFASQTSTNFRVVAQEVLMLGLDRWPEWVGEPNITKA